MRKTLDWSGSQVSRYCVASDRIIVGYEGGILEKKVSQFMGKKKKKLNFLEKTY